MEAKLCTKCRELKPLDQFHKRSNRPTGRESSCKACRAAYQQEHKRDIREYLLVYNLRTKYGLTVEQWQELWDQQDGCCEICLITMTKPTRPTKPTDAHVDHCHETGKVRGLLCVNCNRGLGIFKDEPALLEQAAAYLRRT